MAVLAATLGGTGSVTDLPKLPAEPQDHSQDLGALVAPSRTQALTPDLHAPIELPGDLGDKTPDQNQELAGLLFTPRFLLVTGFHKTVAV